MQMVASFFVSFIALFIVVEPFGAIPLFASLTQHRSRAEQKRIALRASVVGGAVLLAFAAAGPRLLAVLGLRLDAFQVAGGVVLLLAALDLFRGNQGCRCNLDEANPSREDVSIVPLAIPMLAGPGAMGATMSLVGREPIVTVMLAIVAVFVVAFFVLRGAAILQRIVGPAVLAVVLRVLGLLLAALSIQSIVKGLSTLFTWVA
jgi:multiple antibiotic resistance protein